MTARAAVRPRPHPPARAQVRAVVPGWTCPDCGVPVWTVKSRGLQPGRSPGLFALGARPALPARPGPYRPGGLR